MQDLREKWAENILDELNGKSLAWLAARVDVAPSTIHRVVVGDKQGNRMCPSDELKWKIAGVLGVRMDKLWSYPPVIPDWPKAA